MRIETLAMAALALAMLCAAACAPGPRATTVAVTCDEFIQQEAIRRALRVPVGTSWKVTLCSNPTTGFRWEDAAIGDPCLVEMVGREAVGAGSGSLGAAGTEVWTFSARQKGKTTVSFAYSRPWQGGEKGAWKLDLAVVVE